MWRDLKEDKENLESLRAAAAPSRTSIDNLVEHELKTTDTTTTNRPKTETTRPKHEKKPPPVKHEAPKKDDVDNARKETAAKETKVREALKEHQQRVKQEADRLARVESELRKLNAQEAKDIDILRVQLEGVDRQLALLERDYKQKEAAYTKAKDAYESTDARKRSMHEHLALMVLSSEKRKEEKLNELMAKMDQR